MSRNFQELLKAQWESGKFLCVGLDPDYEKIPLASRKTGVCETITAFNRAVIDATKDVVAAYKPNSAFYEQYGDEGWQALRASIQYIQDQAPEVPVILDAKRGDIGNTNEYYARAAFDHLHADALTVHPYLGEEGLSAFLARPEKGIFVLCRTSNPGAREFQDLEVQGRPLFEVVAQHVAHTWNKNYNCGLVVGATYPEEIARVRAIAPEVPFLIPGIGAQGGDLEKSVVAARDAHKRGFLIAASRSILYASDGANYMDAMHSAAKELDSAIRAVV